MQLEVRSVELEGVTPAAIGLRELFPAMYRNVVTPASSCKGPTDLRRLLRVDGCDHAIYDNTTCQCVKWGGPEHEGEHPGVRHMKEHDQCSSSVGHCARRTRSNARFS